MMNASSLKFYKMHYQDFISAYMTLFDGTERNAVPSLKTLRMSFQLFLHKKVSFSKFSGFKLSKSLFLELGSKYFRSESGWQKCILGKLSQCLKITQNVSFEFLSFGTFYQFCPIIPDLSDNTV